MPARDLRKAIEDWMATSKPTHYLVVCWNHPLSLESARKRAGGIIQRMDRVIGGPGYLKHPERRISGFLTIEHLQGNCHGNFVLTFPTTGKYSIENTVSRALSGLPRYGSYDLQAIYDAPGIAHYITKECNPDAIFHTAEFHPAK